MKNHSNTVLQRENDNSSETKLKVTEYGSLTDREFKIGVLKKHNELQTNSKRQFKELRNKINEQKEYFTKEIGTPKKNQTEILELKNSINETKSALESIGNRANLKEERIARLKIEI